MKVAVQIVTCQTYSSTLRTGKWLQRPSRPSRYSPLAPLPGVYLACSSINKLSSDYAAEKEVIGPGCKWRLWRFLKSYQGVKDGHLLLDPAVALQKLPPVSELPNLIPDVAAYFQEAVPKDSGAGIHQDMKLLWRRICTVLNATLGKAALLVWVPAGVRWC